jgi:hypothetical protein
VISHVLYQFIECVGDINDVILHIIYFLLSHVCTMRKYCDRYTD